MSAAISYKPSSFSTLSYSTFEPQSISYRSESYTTGSYTRLRANLNIEKTFTETLTITEGLLSLTVHTTRNANLFEDVTISDAIEYNVVSARQITKTLSDTLTISEALTSAQTKARALPTETVNILEALASLIVHVTRNRSLSENVDITDAVLSTTVRGILKTLTDTVAISEQLAIAQTKQRTISETLDISDAVTITKVSFGNNVTKTLSDTVAISEGLVIAQTKQRLFSESLTISEDLTSLTVRVTRERSLTENVNISDAVVNSGGVIKTLTDNVPVSESLERLSVKERIIPETVNISEALQAYKNGEELIPPIPPTPPEVPNLIGTRERAIRFPKRAPRAIVIDEISNVAIAPLKLLAFSDSNNKAIVGIKPRPALNVARSEIRIGFEPTLLLESPIKTQLEPMIIKARLGLPLSSLNLTTAKLKLRPQVQYQSIHAVKAVNFEKMHKLTRIMKIAMLVESL